MSKFFALKRAKEVGFTLIELLVVIAIIGVLATIVLASLNNARQKSRDSRRVTDIKQLQLALELYFDSFRQYPATVAAMVPTYIPVQPDDPLAGGAPNDYVYFPALTAAGTACGAGVCGYYHMGANLEDSTNIGLTTDTDRCATASAGCNGAAITGTTVNGNDASDCAGGSTGRFCYDVTP